MTTMIIARDEIATSVMSAVEEALGLDPDEAVADATLIDDLGAESIDLLDILFRIERGVGVKIQASELHQYIQGGIPDEEFGDENEIITEAGLAQLKRVMPQIDTDELAGNLQATKVMGLFTVDNLIDLVVRHIEDIEVAA
jgi:acyl carrier protein